MMIIEKIREIEWLLKNYEFPETVKGQIEKMQSNTTAKDCLFYMICAGKYGGITQTAKWSRNIITAIEATLENAGKDTDRFPIAINISTSLPSARVPRLAVFDEFI